MAGRKSRKKRGFSLFYAVYWTLVVLAVAGIGVGLNYLWRLCADYESVQPQYVSAAYEQIYHDIDVPQMISLSGGIELQGFETQAEYEAYVRSWIGDRPVTVTGAYSKDDSLKKYVAKAGGERFSVMTLRKDGTQSEFGFDHWAFDSLTLDIPLTETTYTAKIFSDYDLYVNGVKLDETYLTETGIETFCTGRLPSNVWNPLFNVYTFSTRFGVPQIEARKEDGTVGELIADENSDCGWHMDFAYSDSAQAKMNDYVLKVARAYALFISEDGTRAGILQYVLANSKMEQFIKAYDNDWFTPHSRFEISNAITYDYLVYSPNCFSCNVQFVFSIYSSAGRAQNTATSYRFYFAKVDDEWQLFDYENNPGFDYERYEASKAG